MDQEFEARCLALQVAGSLHDPIAVLSAADAYVRFLMTGEVAKVEAVEAEPEPAPEAKQPEPESGWTFR